MTKAIIPAAANDNCSCPEAVIPGIIRLLAASLSHRKEPTQGAIADAIEAFNKIARQSTDTSSAALVRPVRSNPDVAFQVDRNMLALFRSCYPQANFRTSKDVYLVADIMNPNGGVFPMSFARFQADILLRTEGMCLPTGVRLTYRHAGTGLRNPTLSNLEMVRGGGDSYKTRWVNDITLKAVAEGRCPVAALKAKRDELEASQIARLLASVRSGQYRVSRDVPASRALKQLYSALAEPLGASREAVPGWRKKAIADGLITAQEWQTCLGINDVASASIAA